MSQSERPTPERVLAAICAEAGDISLAEAKAWMARGWIDIQTSAAGPRVQARVAARLTLIRDMRRDMGVDEASLDIVLDLIDKLKLQTDKLACLNAALDRAPSADADAIRRLAAEIFRERMPDTR